MPKKGRGKSKALDPLSIPVELQTALQALYEHYVKTYQLWRKEGLNVPPCFIVVCNNTSTSKLIYDYISGFVRENENYGWVFTGERGDMSMEVESVRQSDCGKGL